MKKFLISTVVVALVAALMGVFVACGDKDSNKDADTAKEAISKISDLYGKGETETKADYKVLGKVKVGNTYCTVKWTVSSSFADYGNYIKVGTMDADDKVPIGITQATEDINYKLKASVTVGKATKSVSFDRKVPAKAAMHAGTEADPYTTLNVQEIALGLEGDDVFYMDGDVAKLVYVEGYVVDPGSHQTGGGGYLGFIYIVNEYNESKDRNADDAIMILSVNYDSQYITKAEDLAKGDKIKVSGYIQKYTNKGAKPAQPEISRWKNGDTYENVTVISLEKPADNRTEQEKVDDALEKVDLVKSYYKTGDVNLPAAPTGVTLSWQVKTDANNFVTVAQDMSKFTIAGTIPSTAANVVLTVTATSVEDNTVKASKDITVKIGQLNLGHAGTQTDPYSTADVDKILETLGDKEVYKGEGTSDKQVYVKGYVTDVGEINGTYGLKNIYIADTANKAAKSVLVYSTNWGGALPKPSEIPSLSPLAEGDLVIVSGYLKNYGGTYEIANSGSTYPIIVAIAKADDTTSDADKVAAVLATVNATLANVESTGNVTLPTSNNAAVTLSWEITEGGYAGIKIDGGKLVVTKLPTDADATVKLKVTATCGADAATADKEVTVIVKTEADVSNITSVTFNFSGITESNADKITDGNQTDLIKGYLGANAAVLTEASVIKAYKGTGTGTGVTATAGCLKFGTSGNNGKITLTFSKNVTKVTINACGWGSSDKLSVNSSADQTVKSFGEGENYVFTLAAASKNVEIVTKDRVIIYSIVVDFETTNEDSTADEKIAAAKEYATEFMAKSYEATTVQLPSSSNGATLTWSVVTSKDVVEIEDNNMTITNPESADATGVQIKVTITCEGGTTVEETYTFTVTYVAPEPPLELEGEGTEANPYTVADAQNILNTLTAENPYLTDDNGAPKQVFIRGYVTNAGNKLSYGYSAVFIGDTADAAEADTVKIFSFSWSTAFPETNTLRVGDQVTVRGYLKNHNGTSKQISDNNASPKDYPIVTVYNAKQLSDAEKITEALAVVPATLANITAAGEITLPTSTIAGVTFVWSIKDNDGKGVIAADADDATKFIATLPSDEDKTVTLVVTASCGTAEDDTKEVTVIVVKASAGVDTVLTATGLGIATSYGNGENKTIDNVTYDFVECMKAGNPAYIQMRTKSGKTAEIKNTSAFSTKIIGVKFVWASTQSAPGDKDVLKVYFADNAEFTNAQEVVVNFGTGKTCEVTMPSGDFTFIKILHNNNGAVYLDSITVTCANPTTEQEGGEAAQTLSLPEALPIED